ncbi:hypothetical protein JCM5296_002164 [Sporobolomyces johnsonii]
MSSPAAAISPSETPGSGRRYTSTAATSSASRRRRPLLWVLGLLVVLVLLAVIIVPPAVVLTRNNKNNDADDSVVTTVVDWRSDFLVCLFTWRFELVYFKHHRRSLDHIRNWKRHLFLIDLPFHVISKYLVLFQHGRNLHLPRSPTRLRARKLDAEQQQHLRLRDVRARRIELLACFLVPERHDPAHRRGQFHFQPCDNVDIQLGERHGVLDEPADSSTELVSVEFEFEFERDVQQCKSEHHHPAGRLRRDVHFPQPPAGLRARKLNTDQQQHLRLRDVRARRIELLACFLVPERHDPAHRRGQFHFQPCDNVDIQLGERHGVLDEPTDSSTELVSVEFEFEFERDVQQCKSEHHHPADRQQHLRLRDVCARRIELFACFLLPERHDPTHRRGQFHFQPCDKLDIQLGERHGVLDEPTDSSTELVSVEFEFGFERDVQQCKSEHHHPSDRLNQLPTCLPVHNDDDEPELDYFIDPSVFQLLDRFFDPHDHDYSPNHDPSHRTKQLAHFDLNYDSIFLEAFLHPTRHHLALDLFSQDVGKRDIDSLERHTLRFYERKKQFALELKDQYDLADFLLPLISQLGADSEQQLDGDDDFRDDKLAVNDVSNRIRNDEQFDKFNAKQQLARHDHD